MLEGAVIVFYSFYKTSCNILYCLLSNVHNGIKYHKPTRG